MNEDTLIAEIKALCQRYAHPGVVTAVHELAGRIVKLIEQQEEEEGCQTNE